MNERDQIRADALEAALLAFHTNVISLPGIVPVENRLTLVKQFVDSIRRVSFVRTIRNRPHQSVVADPSNRAFDPIKAAAFYAAQGEVDEACWLVFLSTHFGKNGTSGWRLLKDVYGALGQGNLWNWASISQSPDGMTQWLTVNYDALTSDGVPRHFGNHRKYESIRPSSSKSTGPVIASYVRWVLSNGGNHVHLFGRALEETNHVSRAAFGRIYDSMKVLRFGRTAKFDYLSMLAKLDLVAIEANSAYLSTSTGPIRGAKLLFGGSVVSNQYSTQELDTYAIHLAGALRVGLQEMEDALCNWQKSPGRYQRFAG